MLVDLLEVLRRSLRMDLAWLGRLYDDELVLQVASGDLGRFGLSLGRRLSRDGSLYAKVLDGDLPSFLPDVRGDPRTRDLSVVRERGIGSYAATPINDSEGREYGVLGCVARKPCPALRDGDRGILRLLATFLTEFVIDLRQLWNERSAVWSHLRECLDQGAPEVVFQPVVELSSGRVVCVEGLARFTADGQEPQNMFAAAAGVGLRRELELAAVRNSLRALSDVPRGVLLSVNASPDTVVRGLLDLVLATGTPERVAVEITEHEHIGDDHDLLLATEMLRGHGTHIAVDDVGSCYSGLEQLLHLRPDVIKMDGYITRGIEADPARRAVAAGLARVAEEIGGWVVAEGIETRAEFDAVIEAGIPYGQGFLLGRPATSVRAACAGLRLPDGVAPRAQPAGHVHDGLCPRL
ncbi:Diguanylate phosphodiesterase with GAF sensor(S) [Frankia canadensis]|uniref:Diguanylate phosphodiesterase with GAF sensor(S) n=1 Tax=Frankia canadensis TaxID=1836972 RepID=A0A2I2KZ15_9ACTN|nr:EAL domain-containing protein [Frankia canadensis]SNQ50890.1 Diguanylate phosphodiesterase with GAF sensor(S) [Frankia canadensis]SOU58180.1 Diguanylate phosphodiesterase with GAF sensor(S) [Frankia canadensis]